MKSLKNITKRITTLGLAVVFWAGSFPVTTFASEGLDPGTAVVLEEEPSSVLTEIADVGGETFPEAVSEGVNTENSENAENAENAEEPVFMVETVSLRKGAPANGSGSQTEITSDNPVSQWSGEMVVNSDVTISGQVRLNEDTHLTVASGKKLTLNEGIFGASEFEDTYYTLTIDGPGTIEMTNLKKNYSGFYKCNIHLKSGTVNVTGGGSAKAISAYNGTVTMDGGTMTVRGGGNSTGSTMCAGISVGNGEVVLNGGTLNVTGGQGASYDSYTNERYPGSYGIHGKVTVNGGTLNVTGGSAVDGGNGAAGIHGEVFLNGGILTATGGKGGVGGAGIDGNVTLAGGKLKAQKGGESGACINGTVSVAENAGGYTIEDSEGSITAGNPLTNEQISAADGKWIAPSSVKLLSGENANYYSTLAAAIEAASVGDAITLLDDLSITTGLTISKNLTIDLNDHYILYTGETKASVIKVENSNLTLTDGTAPDTDSNAPDERTVRYVTLTSGRATSVSTTKPGSGTEGTDYLAVTGGFLAGGTGTVPEGDSPSCGGGVYNDLGYFTMDSVSIAGCTADNGGAVFVTSGATPTAFRLIKGTITGCSATQHGGAVYCDLDNDQGFPGAFGMDDGSIIDCTAAGNGGAVYSKGDFEMDGGSIKGCTATGVSASGDGSGGAVYAAAGSYLTMRGGEISGNSAGESGFGGGMYVDMNTSDVNCSFIVSGAPVIKDNFVGGTKNATTGLYEKGNGAVSNVLLGADAFFTIDGGSYNEPTGLTSGAELHVSGGKGRVIAVKKFLTQTESEYRTPDDAEIAAFVSDNENLEIVVGQDDGEHPALKLASAWDSLQAQFDNASTDRDNPTEITLDRDYVADADEQSLTIPGGRCVSLDLNGHYILITGSNKSVFQVKGIMTLTDSTAEVEKTTRYVKLDNTGRGTEVSSSKPNGTEGTDYLEVSGGFITGGSATNGGGVCISEYGRFTLNGGTICGCTAVGSGGGVYVDSIRFTMNGGEIYGCTAVSGGGAGVEGDNNFMMYGGTIRGCVSTNSDESKPGGGGVYVSGSKAWFRMSGNQNGNAVITGCASGTNGGGVYVGSGSKFTMSVDSKPVGFPVITGCSAKNGGGVYVAGEFGMYHGNIHGNNASVKGGGVYVKDDTGCSFMVQSSPLIKDNFRGGTKGTDGVYVRGDGTASDVVLNGDQVITVTRNLEYTDPAACIFIDDSGMEPGRVIAKPGDERTYGLHDYEAACFHGDTGCRIGVKNGNAVLLRPWESLNADFAEASTDEANPTMITLNRDYVSDSLYDESGLTIPEGRYVTLDLNDHYILFTGDEGEIFKVQGALTLKDSIAEDKKTTRYVEFDDTGRGKSVTSSRPNDTEEKFYLEVKGGLIAGGFKENNGNGNGGEGGGVSAIDGSFRMYGGTICGCTADSGGGVFVKGDTGSFRMYGGTISCCRATSGGGGVYLLDGGSFSMDGGAISGCSTASHGGGINVGGAYSVGIFRMSGNAIITGCDASGDGAGVYVNGQEGSIFSVSGSPVIKDNLNGGERIGGVYVKGTAGVDNNVLLEQNRNITVTGALTDSANICVYAKKGDIIAVPGTPSGGSTAYTLKDTDAACFHSDRDGSIGAVDGGKVMFKEALPEATLTNTSMVYNGSAFSPTISFEDATLEKDEDYTLSYRKAVAAQETPLIDAPKDAGSYKLVVAGQGSYTGSKELDFTITQKPVTVSGIKVKNKIYDGGITAELITTDAEFTGICDGDTLTVSGTGSFADAYADDMEKTVSISDLTLGGASKDNYIFAENGKQKETTAKINKKKVTITGLSAKDKVYDGTTAATVVGTAMINGMVENDEVNVTNGTAAFSDKNAGTAKMVTFSGYSLEGTAAGNYLLLGQPESVTAEISKKSVTVTGGITAGNKTYDGSAAATLDCSAAFLEGKVDDDELTILGVSGAFSDAKAGENKTVTLDYTDAGLHGDAAANYVLAANENQKTATADISKATMADPPAAITKRYLYSRDNKDRITLIGLPSDCGTVTWKTPKTSGSLEYTTAPAVSDEGVLSYIVQQSGTADQTGTVTVVAQTQNYNDVTFAVGITLVDQTSVKLKDDTSVILKSSTLTYGQKLSALQFNTVEFVSDDESETAIEGTLSWKNPESAPIAGTTSAVWEFTPSDASYAACEGTVAITVNKATPVIQTLPAATAITYGQTLTDSDLSGGEAKVGDTAIEGTFAWKTGTAKPSVADSGKTEYDVVFTPNDTTNYETAACTVTLTVNKADPTVTAPIARTGLFYSGSSQALVKEGSTNGGLMQYALGENGTTPPESGWSKEVPTGIKAKTYHVWYRTEESGDYKASVPACVAATIAKIENGTDTIPVVEVQCGENVPVSVNLKAYLGEEATQRSIAKQENQTGSLSFTEIRIADDTFTLTFKVTSTGGRGSIVLTAETADYTSYELTIPVVAKSKTTEVKLEETPGVNTAVEGAKVSGLDAYTDSQTETTVKVELDVKTENAPSDSNVQKKIDNKIALVFSGVEETEVEKEYLDISVTKTVGETTTTVSDVGRVIEIAVKYDLTGKFNPVVIREHNGSVAVFTALIVKPNQASDYKDATYYVEAGTGTIYIYSEFFSTYSIAYATTGSYTVSFDAQGGSGVNAIVVKAGGTIPAGKIPVSSKSGHRLDGWFTEKSGGSKLTSETVINSDITYYAKWTQNSSGGGTGGGGTGGGGGGGTPVTVTCTVRFDMNEKTVADAPASQSVEQGGTAVRPAKDPEAEGFTFDGWYREAACENLFDFSTPITADTVIYAKWIEKKAETFTVTFDLNGKPGTAPAAQTVEKDGCAKEPAAPETEGFTFTGWFTEAACSTKYDFSTPVTADLTLYAGWEAKTEPGPGPGPEPEPEPEPVVVEDDAAWNLYEDASEHEYQILGISATETVANSNVKSKAYYDAKITGSTITVKVTGDRKKAALAANALLEFDLGSAGVVEYALPVCYVKPVFKLSSTSATIKSGKETTLKTTVLVKCADGNFAPYDMTDVQVSGTGLGTVTKGEDGSIEIKTSAAGRGKIGIVKDTWDGAKAVNFAYTVKGSKKDVLSVDLQGLKTVVVNSNAKGQAFGFDVMFNGASVSSSDLLPIVDKKNTGLATISDDGKLVIAYKDGVRNGTYTVTLQSKESKEAKTNVKIRVNGKKLDKAITTRILRKYDVVTKQSMVVVPNLRDIGGRIETVSVAEEGFTAKLNAAGNIEIDYIGDTNDTESANTSEKHDVESAGTDAANAVGNAIINEKYNVRNLNIGTLTLSLTITGIDDPVTLPLKNVRAKKTTPTAKVGIVTIPAGVNPVEGQVIGTANIVSTYKVSSGMFRTIKPVKAEILGTPKGVTAKVHDSDPFEIDIYSISKKNAQIRVKLTYAGGVTKTVTVRVKKK